MKLKDLQSYSIELYFIEQIEEKRNHLFLVCLYMVTFLPETLLLKSSYVQIPTLCNHFGKKRYIFQH